MDIRSKILTESSTLFFSMGIRSVTMDCLAEHLGISKRTIYENFRDKDEIVLHSLVKSFNEYNIEINRIVNDAPNVLEAIYKVGKKNNDIFAGMNSLFLHDLKKYHSNVYDLLIEKGGTTSSQMNLMLFKRGINEGIFRKEINVDLVNILLNHIMEWIHSGNPSIFLRFSKDDFRKSVIMPFLIGICTKKGLELLKKLDNINEE